MVPVKENYESDKPLSKRKLIKDLRQKVENLEASETELRRQLSTAEEANSDLVQKLEVAGKTMSLIHGINKGLT